ncbi:MAG TPA: hypothetical protein VFR08_10875 [Candidatus Angelobacter sp.]|nr:hypothetical protein [Candidatus Angelobacter sp.]
MPKLLIAACPVLWITSGWTLWDAINVLNDENWDRLNSGALGIIAAAVGVFSLSGFMALIGLLNL